MTHLLYAFWNIDEHSCEIVSVDPYADFDRVISGAESTCLKDQGSHGADWGQGCKSGTLSALTSLRAQAPHMKLLLSVGGWSMSSTFSKCAQTAADRQKIVSSVKKFIVDYDFDGIDYDWEYPGIERTDGDGVPKFASKYYWDAEHDRDNLVALLSETRTMLTSLQAERSRDNAYLQTIAIGMGPDKLNYLEDMFRDPETMDSSLDYINMMTYDFHGPWGNHEHPTYFGHNAPLYAPKNNPQGNVGMSLQESVDTMKNWVAPQNHKKLVLGLPTYGRAIQIEQVFDAAKNPVEFDGDVQKLLDNAALIATKGVLGTWETASVSYWEQADDFDGASGWEVKFDESAQQPYLWNAKDKTFMSYDTPDTIKTKVQWLDQQGLGGAMFWEMDDDPFFNPKTGAAREGEKLFDAVVANMQSCTLHPRNRRSNDIFV